jgi:hypothetical protein
MPSEFSYLGMSKTMDCVSITVAKGGPDVRETTVLLDAYRHVHEPGEQPLFYCTGTHLWSRPVGGDYTPEPDGERAPSAETWGRGDAALATKPVDGQMYIAINRLLQGRFKHSSCDALLRLPDNPTFVGWCLEQTFPNVPPGPDRYRTLLWNLLKDVEAHGGPNGWWHNKPVANNYFVIYEDFTSMHEHACKEFRKVYSPEAFLRDASPFFPIAAPSPPPPPGPVIPLPSFTHHGPHYHHHAHRVH